MEEYVIVRHGDLWALTALGHETPLRLEPTREAIRAYAAAFLLCCKGKVTIHEPDGTIETISGIQPIEKPFGSRRELTGEELFTDHGL